MITVKTPGKIHLIGEHAVVYGKPALLATVDRYCEVNLTPSLEKNISITAKNLGKTITLTPKMVLDLTHNANKIWQRHHQDNLNELLKSIITDDIQYPAIAVGETFRYFKKTPEYGFSLTIHSDIPLGAGLGSSASLAVAIVTAVSAFLGETPDKKIINEIAYLTEQKKHGIPSGGDNTVVCFGGLIQFQKDSGITPLDLNLNDFVSKNFLLINTGKPKETTGEMVSAVKDLFQKQPKIIEQFLYSQEKLTEEFVSALKKGDDKEIIRIIQKGENNLESIGVVSESTRQLIRNIEKTGGAAKISGAGGKKKGSGIVLAYHTNSKKVEDLLQSQALNYFTVKLGVEGVKIL